MRGVERRRIVKLEFDGLPVVATWKKKRKRGREKRTALT